MRKAPFNILVLPLLIAALSGCGVKIQTGPETPERAREAGETRGHDLKVTWAEQLRTADGIGKLTMTHSLIDSVIARYLGYGHEVTRQWREGTAGRNQEISDVEMRKVVAQWSLNDKPILEAYEDMIEYGVDEIEHAGQINSGPLDLLKSLREQFYKIYSAVFYPTGSPDQYEESLRDLETEAHRLSRDLHQQTESLR